MNPRSKWNTLEDMGNRLWLLTEWIEFSLKALYTTSPAILSTLLFFQFNTLSKHLLFLPVSLTPPLFPTVHTRRPNPLLLSHHQSHLSHPNNSTIQILSQSVHCTHVLYTNHSPTRCGFAAFSNQQTIQPIFTIFYFSLRIMIILYAQRNGRPKRRRTPLTGISQ